MKQNGGRKMEKKVFTSAEVRNAELARILDPAKRRNTRIPAILKKTLSVSLYPAAESVQQLLIWVFSRLWNVAAFSGASITYRLSPAADTSAHR
jgi:hypothetical protein